MDWNPTRELSEEAARQYATRLLADLTDDELVAEGKAVIDELVETEFWLAYGGNNNVAMYKWRLDQVVLELGARPFRAYFKAGYDTLEERWVQADDELHGDELHGEHPEPEA